MARIPAARICSSGSVVKSRVLLRLTCISAEETCSRCMSRSACRGGPCGASRAMLHVQRCLSFYNDFKGWKCLDIACGRIRPAFTIVKLGEKAACSIQHMQCLHGIAMPASAVLEAGDRGLLSCWPTVVSDYDLVAGDLEKVTSLLEGNHDENMIQSTWWAFAYMCNGTRNAYGPGE